MGDAAMWDVGEFPYYRVGGSLEANHPTYVLRQADEELYQGILQGEFCYVLNSRQMGKSSLRVQMMRRLRQRGVRCVALDMTRIGKPTTQAEWYGGMVSELIRGLGLGSQIDFRRWWAERGQLPPVQRLGVFLEEVLLRGQLGQGSVAEAQTPVVIFVDEVDSLLGIPFKDEFFRFIRSWYDERAIQPLFYRLTFVLLGVAAPADLLADRRYTPFGMGRAIALEGFRLAEAEPLLPGLAGVAERPLVVLQAILDWTGGQPFLTQRLCSLVAGYDGVIPLGQEAATVSMIVQTQILDDWEAQDEPEHLRSVRDRLRSDKDVFGRWFGLWRTNRSRALLRLYRRVLRQGNLATDGSLEQTLLQLSGIVVKRGGALYPYNRIYQTLFDAAWVRSELARLRQQTQWRRQLLLPLVASVALVGGAIAWKAHQNWLAVASRNARELSRGEDLLLPGTAMPRKRLGIAAFAAGDYAKAVRHWQQYLNQRNIHDPEVLIYLNNAAIAHQPTYTLAVVVPLTSGDTLDPALEILDGVAQVQTQINRQGGINGRPLQILIANDDDHPDRSRQIAQALVSDASVLGVIGHFSSDATRSALPIYDQAELAVISATSSAVTLGNPGDFFRTIPNDQAIATALVTHLRQRLHRERVALYYDANSRYSQSLRQAVKRFLGQSGGTTVAEFDLSDDRFRADTSVQMARQAGAAALVMTGGTRQLERSIQVMFYREEMPLLGGDSWYNPRTLIEGQEAALGLIIAVPWIANHSQFEPQGPRSVEQFQGMARSLWGGEVSWRSVLSYDAAIAMATALRQAQTRPGLRQVLARPTFWAMGATGIVQFDREGDRTGQIRLVEVRRGNQSGLGFDFVALP